MISVGVVFILMLFLHIIDDYCLQSSSLCSLKQKSYWVNQFETQQDYIMYGYDYIVALLMHAFSWTVMISFPLIIYSNWNPHYCLYIFIFINTLIHAFVDNLKANEHKINLITDQSIHILQIIITFFVYMAVY